MGNKQAKPEQGKPNNESSNLKITLEKDMGSILDRLSADSRDGEVGEVFREVKALIEAVMKEDGTFTVHSNIGSKNNLLSLAVARGNVLFVQRVLKELKVNASIKPSGTFAQPHIVLLGDSAHSAKEYKAIFKLLVAAGADPKDTSGFCAKSPLTTLISTFWMRDKDAEIADCVTFAIAEGKADPNALISTLSLNDKGVNIQLSDANLLHLAAAKGRPKTACALIDAGTDPRQKCGEDRLPAETAALRPGADPKFVELLTLFAADPRPTESATATWAAMTA